MAHDRGRVPARKAITLTLTALLTGALSSCYSYEPVRGPFPDPGVEVRAYLSAGARDRMEDLLLPDQRWLEGSVVRSGPDTLVLRVNRRPAPGTPGGRFLAQEVPLTEADIGGLEVREMDRLRTGILTGTLTAAGIALLYRIIEGRGEDTREPTPPGPTDARIPGMTPPGVPR